MKVIDLFKTWRLCDAKQIKFSVYLDYEETLLWEGYSIESMPKEIGEMDVVEWAEDRYSISALWCFAKKKKKGIE